MHTKRKKWRHVPNYIIYHLKSEVSITLRCRLCSTRYTAVRIKNCLKSTSAITIATMKNTDNFLYGGKPSHATAKSTLFTVSKDEWDTKEDTGKSMKNALYGLWYAKGISWAEATSNSEKIKPVALEPLKALVTQSVSRKFY